VFVNSFWGTLKFFKTQKKSQSSGNKKWKKETQRGWKKKKTA